MNDTPLPLTVWAMIASGLPRAVRHAGRSAAASASRSWPSTSTHVPAERRPLLARAAAGPAPRRCARSPATCCNRRRPTRLSSRWRAPAWPLPRPSPRCTRRRSARRNAERHAGDPAGQRHAQAERQAVAQRARGDFHAGHAAGARMLGQRRAHAAVVLQLFGGKKPRSASVAYSALPACPLLRITRSLPGSSGASGFTRAARKYRAHEDLDARQRSAEMGQPGVVRHLHESATDPLAQRGELVHGDGQPSSRHAMALRT